MSEQGGVDVKSGLELSEEELEGVRGGLDELAPEAACQEPIMPEAPEVM